MRGSPAAGGGALGGGGDGSQAWGLYRCTHRADCELRLGGHDVCGLDVAVVHRVLKRGPNIRVLVASVAIERNFGSSPGSEVEHEQAVKRLRALRGRGRLWGGVGGSGPGVGRGACCGPSCPCPVPVLVEIKHKAGNDEGDERHQDGGCH